MKKNHNNGWYDEIEKLCDKWHKKSLALNWKHNLSSQIYNRRNKYIGIPTVIINAFTGTTVFLNLDTTSQCERNYYLQIVIGFILILTAILSAIQNYLSLPAEASKHENAATRYHNFATSIETELSLPRSERLNGKIFIKHAQKRFSELLELSKNIPSTVEKEYLKFIKNNPNNEEFYEIVINDDKDNSSYHSDSEKEEKEEKEEEEKEEEEKEEKEENEKNNCTKGIHVIDNDNDNGYKDKEKNKSFQDEIRDELKAIKANEAINKKISLYNQKQNQKQNRKQNRNYTDKIINYF